MNTLVQCPWACNLYLSIKIENHPFIPLLVKFLLLLNPTKGSLKS